MTPGTKPDPYEIRSQLDAFEPRRPTKEKVTDSVRRLISMRFSTCKAATESGAAEVLGFDGRVALYLALNSVNIPVAL
jgi:hypothetical protein